MLSSQSRIKLVEDWMITVQNLVIFVTRKALLHTGVTWQNSRPGSDDQISVHPQSYALVISLTQEAFVHAGVARQGSRSLQGQKPPKSGGSSWYIYWPLAFWLTKSPYTQKKFVQDLGLPILHSFCSLSLSLLLEKYCTSSRDIIGSCTTKSLNSWLSWCSWRESVPEQLSSST